MKKEFGPNIYGSKEKQGAKGTRFSIGQGYEQTERGSDHALLLNSTGK